MACNAQGHGTIKVVELTTPSTSARRMPALHAWDLPKSSALMINKRASSGYPSIRLVWLRGSGVIVPVSLVSCFAGSIPGVLLSIKPVSSHGEVGSLSMRSRRGFCWVQPFGGYGVKRPQSRSESICLLKNACSTSSMPPGILATLLPASHDPWRVGEEGSSNHLTPSTVVLYHHCCGAASLMPARQANTNLTMAEDARIIMAGQSAG